MCRVFGALARRNLSGLHFGDRFRKHLFLLQRFTHAAMSFREIRVHFQGFFELFDGLRVIAREVVRKSQIGVDWQRQGIKFLRPLHLTLRFIQSPH